MNRRRGFTLIELLFSTAILSVLALGIFNVFRTTNRQASQAAWISVAQKEIRNGLKRIHDELSKASVYTLLTPSSVELLNPDTGAPFTLNSGFTSVEFGDGAVGHEAQLRTNFDVLVDGTLASPEIYTPAAGSTQTLLNWRQCVPKRRGFGATDPDENGSAAVCEVYLDGNTLFFQRSQTDSTGDPVQEVTLEMIHNVVEVQTAAIPRADPNEPLVGTEVILEVTVEHPNTGVFKNSRLSQRLTARVPVGQGAL